MPLLSLPDAIPPEPLLLRTGTLRAATLDYGGSQQFKAARELGLNRIEFMELLKQRGIPYVVYTLEDYEQDMKTLERLQPEIEQNLKESGAGRLK